MMYFQCLLKKTDVGALCIIYTVAWLPEKFAHSLGELKLQEEDGSWSTGWKVAKIYRMEDEKFVLEHERDFIKQRKTSDI